MGKMFTAGSNFFEMRKVAENFNNKGLKKI